MNQNDHIFNESIIRNMREGVFTVDRTGHITSMNPSAMKILQRDETVIGQTVVNVFFDGEGNDEFCEAILAAIYQNAEAHNEIVNYRVPGGVRQLFMSTSYLTDEQTTVGLTVVINDITELNELRDAVKAMEKIRALNAELEKRNQFIKKTFGRYLSDEIVSTILETRDGLDIGGKKQDVTIMFTDLRGFTALSEKMLPADLISMLNHYLERMIEIIFAHKGTILEFIGDAIVCVFGAPLERSTRNYDAVSCAISMQRDMENVNGFNREHGYPPIEMGIGIHSGEVVLGNIGSTQKTKYDIIGRNVNLASRIETYTVGGQILISDTVKQALGTSLSVGKIIEIMPKGVSSPIPVYEVRALDDLQMPDETQHFRVIDPPAILECCPIDGKHMSAHGFTAELRALSEKEILLSFTPPIGDDELSLNTTVTITVPAGMIYAKFIGERDGLRLFHITSGSADDLKSILTQG